MRKRKNDKRTLGAAGKTRDWSGIRLAAVAAVFGAAWLALWCRAFHVQVLLGPELAERAGRQHVAAFFVAGERGRILDRNGRVLAKSVRVQSVYARPSEVDDVSSAVRSLSGILHKPANEIAARLQSESPFVWLARRVGDKQAAQLHRLGVPGIGLTAEYGRTYPNGHLAGQLLGFVGDDGKGLEGLELSFDERLSGKRTLVRVQRDAGGDTLAPAGEGPNVRGEDLVLTLDADIQFVAERALASAVEEHRASSGVCLVVEVSSGEILAWAQYPFFNPNVFREYSPDAWRNRAAMDAMEPGSTAKPFLVAAALQAGVVTPDTEYFCEDGTWRMPGATFNDTHEYGLLDVRSIVRYSSNIGAAKIGLDLGAENYRRSLSGLGFGSRTGLPLPGESRGILRPAHEWTAVDLAAASFGQGFSATPLQLARAYACLAGGGVLRPLSVVRGSGEPGPAPRQVFDPGVAGDVREMLRQVVQADGTGRQARVQGLEVGGKTGTAQKASPDGGYAEKYLASFVGLFPALEPEYVVYVSVDEPEPHHYGGVVAAPVVRRVAVESLLGQGMLTASAPQGGSRDDLPVEPVQEAASKRPRIDRFEPPARGKVPSVVGLSVRRAVEAFAGSGRVPSIRGSGGFVVRQQPRPGVDWPEGREAVLWLSDHDETYGRRG